MTQELHHQSGEPPSPGALDEDWLTPREVCDLLKIDNETLRRWARQGTGPPVLRMARTTPRYGRRDLTQWIEHCRQPTVTTTTDTTPASQELHQELLDWTLATFRHLNRLSEALRALIRSAIPIEEPPGATPGPGPTVTVRMDRDTWTEALAAVNTPRPPPPELPEPTPAPLQLAPTG